MKWQPIETAPKDGTRVLICDAHGQINIAHWAEEFDALDHGLINAWVIYDCDDYYYSLWVKYPAHWMPLPQPYAGE